MASIGMFGLSMAAFAQPVGTPSAPVPSREQTFREIGRSLQTMERSVAPVPVPPRAPTASGTGAQPAVTSSSQAAPAITAGAELTASTPITAFTGPSPTAAVGATISPGTAVRVEGIDRGFVQMTPLQGPASGQALYVPEGAVKTGFSDYLGARVSEMMEQVSRLATTLENNPYVRLKGFKVNVSVTPSLDVEFEMKGPEIGQSAATAR